MTGYQTSIGSSDESSIRLLGHDLAGELIGHVGFSELAFWLVALRRPTSAEVAVFDAVLVALADHGLTPSAIAARLTLTGAPESLQGALAAGLLGGGSRFLGVTEDTGRFLATALAEHASAENSPPTTDDGFDAVARAAVERERAAGRYVPGLGHPIHRQGDPRTPVLLGLAADRGVAGPHVRLLEAVGRVHPDVLGRRLPVNGAGACAALLCDLGLPPHTLRGFALLARTAGLLGQLAEELREPIGPKIYDDVDRATQYRPPA